MQTPSSHINQILSGLPELPGIYQYLGEEGRIIYVGKAKNLKKRVLSYFNKNHNDSPKTAILVKRIRDIRYTVVENEQDALLLENNLIKEHQPRYNVLLKDDKTYPSICIKNECFPRVFQTRRILKDGSEYFGPYSSVPMVKAILDLIGKLHPLRSCSLDLSEKKISSGKYRVCLDYHIKKCQGPCVGLQSEADYNKNIDEIRHILKGNLETVEEILKKEIKEHAEALRFEEAQNCKNKMELLDSYRSKSYIVNSNIRELDVFSWDETENAAFINYLHVHNGCIVQTYTFEYRKKIEEDKESLLASGIYEMRSRFKSESKEVVVPFIPSMELDNVKFHVPKRGDRKKLLDLSKNNVRQYKMDLLKQEEKLNPEQRSTRILQTLKKDLQLSELPVHIECFDNSNIQGSSPVASCVVFKKGKASKKDYRHFNIKTVPGIDDFASMKEIITRRYMRQAREEQGIPQLVIVDGGKGQLSSAVEAHRHIIELCKKENIDEKILSKIQSIRLIGIAKRLEEIYFPNDPTPLYLNKNSESLKLIQQIRDEAHRFGITFHRKLRSKVQIKSELDEIPGIGKVTKNLLLEHFKSLKKIREADSNELEKIVGKSKANNIINYFKSK
ncbi:MAG: excinuclease ABC subunit UvrC [Bacteroidales bacterium]|jgi:excinuclease ABC subunit C|nr:excinuclease ABC subunit UvrC [Bacteroidales bacterium]MBP8981560.1 excinuclease ABC subunit UvrC [Bacteroidales bacterium]HNZ80919.1 excinuclease ABC subunit UvrC [Bacteroidales bacterium]HOH23750.1 excinuclease ABC subunit UvrC [Bacteroidales bacterium]HPY58633.1 excinuclease ABC subunit UvrC [Bacteroidales bacterium]